MSTIWQLLQHAAETWPTSIAISDAEANPATYAEFYRTACRCATRLRDLGISPGDRVALFERNRRGYLEYYFAVAGLGAILVPINTRLTRAEVEGILQDSGASLLAVGEGMDPGDLDIPRLQISDREDAPEAPGDQVAPAFRPASVRAEDVAHLYYTSGTTGEPKGVMLTHGNVCAHAAAAVVELELAQADAWAHIAPMFHLADAWAVFAITQVGGRHVMLPSFDAADALRTLAQNGVSITNLVPTMLQRMVAHPLARKLRYPALRMLLSGGAPIAPATVRKILDVFGCDYAQTYGMTETSPYLTISLLHDHLRELPAEQQMVFKCKTGRPFRGVDLKVVDEQGREVPRDDTAVGEILVRGETVTPGYWRRADATTAAFVEGWLQTGDLATIDAEGYVNIVDRKKDVILSGGETVYSVEVEKVLFHHPEIVEAAVFGRPDPEWGEAVHAAVVVADPSRGISSEQIQEHCRQRLAGFKVPRTIIFLDELPRMGSGKVSKRLLRSELR